MITEKHLFTKNDLKRMIFNFDYSMFRAPQERFKDLFDSTFETVKNEATFLYAVRKAGKMFTYDRGIVPISVYFLKSKQKNDTVYYVRFIAHTIDDYSMGFFKRVDSVEEYEDFVKNVVKPYLNSFTEMPSQEEFSKFFKKHNVVLDFS